MSLCAILKTFGWKSVLPISNQLFRDDSLMIRFYSFEQRSMLKSLKNIRFTSEIEENGSQSFLDITITRENNKSVTSVYSEPTFSGVVMVPKRKLAFVLPYLGKLSLYLRTRRRRAIERDLPYCKLKIIFRSKCRLNTLFRFKDPLEKKIRSGIIYRYTCSNSKVTYYGKTFHLKR